MLPHVDGLEVVPRGSRKQGDGVIADYHAHCAGEESERILGLEVGGDDYLAKPFSPNWSWLPACCALRRRAQRLPAPRENTLAYGPIALDTERHIVTSDGSPVILICRATSCLRTCGAINM